MIDTIFHARLRPVIKRRQIFALWCGLAAVWLLAALGGWLMAWLSHDGAAIPTSWKVGLVLGTLIASGAVWLRYWLAEPDLRALARQLEMNSPDLDGRLLTAVQQAPDKKGAYHFLQERLFEDVVRHSVDHDWLAIVPQWRINAARAAQCVGVAGLVAALFAWRPSVPGDAAASAAATAEVSPEGVTVTPGDTSMERGTSFTVLARFGDRSAPSSADLVVGESADSEQRVPLVKNLADPTFGATLPGVDQSFSYRIDYGGERTRDFKVTVFEYPRLERSDAELTYPAYTALPPKRIEDTKRISAVEGTKLALTLQLNKPVASAVLTPRDRSASALTLTVDPAHAVAQLAGHTLTVSGTYELRLTDADGRTNRTPDVFVIDALPNRPPELKLASPRGDVRPSPLEEVTFNGTAWDDFGVVAYGLAITREGRPAEIIEFGRAVPAREKKSFNHMVRLEEMEVNPDDLLSWSVWADDIGPDGNIRRTQGDLFFAEVRPFEEVFREGSGGAESAQQQQQQQGQQGSPASRLAELQKQIISATWKLQRATPPGPTYPKDAVVVRDSQAQAIGQAEEAAAEVDEPRRAALWKAATSAMKKALDKLTAAPDSPAVLPDALIAEQSAYQALLRLKEREHQVIRGQKGSQSQSQASAGAQQQQKQIDELDLEQSANRYETQREAQAQPTAERREEMQVQNRLQELARRQQGTNEKLKELQTALQEAKTDEQREELRRKLKRLEEEERQMLADMDELRQRMDRAENQSQMAEQRQQLDKAREDAQRAAEAAAKGDAPQALAAGTRTERQLQEMRDEMRRKSAGQFAEDLRQMRSEARDLAQKQEKISEKVANPETPPRKSLSDPTPQEETLKQLAEQQKRAADVVKRATQLSEEAEVVEPLVSRQLYDTVRQFTQTDEASVKEALRERQMTTRLFQQLQEMQEKTEPGRAIALTAGMLRDELKAPADAAARQAQAGLNQLRTGVEKAAESVLGDDTAALQLAEKELEALAQEVAREAASAQGEPEQPGQEGQSPNKGQGGQSPGSQGTPTAGAQAGGQQGEQPPNEGKSPEAANAQAANGQPSEQPGQNPGQGKNPGENPQGQGSGRPQDATPRDGRQSGQVATNEGRGGRQQSGGPNANGRGTAAAPLTGEGFTNWSDRLREVEEMIEFPDLRNGVASARDRARVMRLEAKRDLKKPDWAVVKLEILKPLVEVRQRVKEELLRRSSDHALAPLDRDPVPGRYTELVRRYYEELGKDK